MRLKINSKRKSVLTLLFVAIAFSIPAFSANRYWVSSGASNWNNTGNWSASSGGASGASVPGAGDVAIFDGTGGLNGNCSIDMNVSVSGILMNGYSGTLSQNSFTITCGANGYTQTSGTFAGGSQSFTINTTGVFNLSGGTFTSTSGTFTISGTRVSSSTVFTHSAGTFNHNNGTFFLNTGSGCTQFTHTLDLNGSSTQFYNVTLTTTTGCSPQIIATGSGDVLMVSNTLTHNDGIFNGTAELTGNFAVGASADGGYGTITINGTGSQTYTQTGTGRTAILNVNKSSGTFTPATSPMDLYCQSFVLQAGDFTAPSGNMNIGGTWDANQTLFNHTGGNFSHNNGTVVFNPNLPCTQRTLTIDVLNTTAFYSVTFQGTTGCTPAIFVNGSGDVLDINNNLTHTDGILNSSANIKGNLILLAGADGGYGTLTINGTGNQTYSQTGTSRTGLIVVNKPSGNFTPASSPMDFFCQSFDLQSGNFTAPSGNLNIGGTWDANAVLFSHSGGTFSHNNGTVTFNPNLPCTQRTFTIDVINSTSFYNVAFQGTTGCSPAIFVNASGDVLDVTNDLTHTDGILNSSASIKGNLILLAGADGGNGTLTINGSGNQTYSQTGTARTGFIVVNKPSGSFTPASSPMNFFCQSFDLQAGSYTAPSGTLNIGGFWNSNATLFNHAGGTFTHNNGTVEINPNLPCTQYTYTLDVLPTTVFYNMIINGTTGCSSPIITTAGGDVVNVQNNFTHTHGILNGLVDFNGDLTIGSTSDGGTGTITAKGTGFQKYVYAAGAARTCKIIVDKPSGVLSPQTGTTALSCQTFSLIHGMFIAPTGNMNIGGIWDANQTLFLHSGGAFDNNGGTVVINPNLPCTQRTFTLDVLPSTWFYNMVINGTTGCSSPIITTASGDVIQMAGDFTHTDGIINGDFTFWGNLSIAATSDGGTGTLTANGNGAQTYSQAAGSARTIQIIVDKPSGTFSAAGGTTNFNMQSFTLKSGTFTAPTGNMNIGGIWNNNQTLFNHMGGTFSHNNGTVVLNPNLPCTQYTFTVDVLPSTQFYNFQFNGTTGCSSPIFANGAGDSLDVINNLTYTDGISNNLVTAGGNVTVASTFDGGNGKLIFTGSNAQNFDLTGATALFNGSIIVDKAANNVTLLSTCTLDAGASQSISFQNGKMITTSSNLLRVDRTVGVSGGNSNSFVSGPMVRMIANNGVNNNIFFPIGAGSQYRQALLNVTHTSAANFDYTAEVKNISAQTLGLTLPGTVDKVSPVRYWQIDRSATGNLSAASVQLFYGADDGVTDNSNLRLVKGNGGNWDNIGGTGSANGSGSITSSVNFTTFSPFALANANGGTNFPGSALNFVGGDDYVSVPSGGGLDNLQSGTIEMWVKWTGTQDAGYLNTSYGAVLARQSNGVFTNQLIALNGSDPATAKIIWNPYAYGTTAITSTAAAGNGVWNHIAITYASGNHKMYINGVLVGTSTLTGTISTNTSKALTIGGWIDDGQGFSTSTIDEVRIWNRVLCQGEIQNNMSCEIPTSASGLLANYHFNQGIGEGNNSGVTSLNDASGNSRTGTLNNMALNGTTSNWVSSGAVANGISCGVYGPEINVKGNSVSITDGDVTPSAADHTDFGDVNVNTPFTRTYTIENLGVSPLTISSIGLSGANPTLFSVGALNPAGPIAASGSATVTVTFLPTTTGTKTATLTINSDDCDEAAYDFALQGNSVTPAGVLHFDGWGNTNPGGSNISPSTYDYVSIPDNGTMDLDKTYTIEAWVYLDDNKNNTIIDKGDYRYLFQTHPNGNTGLGLYNPSMGWVYSSGSVPTGAWHHIATTFDANAQQVVFYLDGAVLSTHSSGLFGPVASPGPDNGIVTIGRQQPSSCVCNNFDGKMEELRVWSRVLCQSEIQHNMNCELTGTQKNLAAYFQFNQGLAAGTNTSVTTLNDASGNGNSGTLTNFALTGSSSNWVAAGPITTGVSCSPLCDSTNSVATAAGTYTSTTSYTSPSSGFTHYCDCQNKLLLSLKLGGTGAVIPDNGISLKINSTGSNFYAHNVGFVGNTFGYAAMDRTWNVSPTTQPTSKVPVRFYFNSSDISSLDNTLTTNGLPGIFNANDLSFWKVINGSKPAHAAVPALSQYDVKVITYSAVATDSTWVLGDRSGGNYFAQFFVNGFSGGGGGAGPLGLTPLPIDLLYLTATGVDNKYIQVKWATAQEHNTAWFEVERSENGKDFVKIGTLTAAGNSESPLTYSFKDVNAKTNKQYYYRLRVVETGGNSTITYVVSAKLNQLVPTTIVMYPNPANTELNIVWPEGTETASVVINGADGREVYNQNVDIANSSKINVSSFSQGVYIVSLHVNGTVINSRLVIKR